MSVADHAADAMRATGRNLDREAMRQAHRGNMDGAVVLLSAAMAYACAADGLERMMRLDEHR